MTSLDLENHFFHIWLAPDMCKFQWFTVPAVDSPMQFFEFMVMAYGVQPAVTIVTRMLRPIKAYIQTLGIWFSIDLDDGHIAVALAQLCSEQTDFLLLALQRGRGGLENSVEKDSPHTGQLIAAPRIQHRLVGNVLFHHT